MTFFSFFFFFYPPGGKAHLPICQALWKEGKRKVSLAVHILLSSRRDLEVQVAEAVEKRQCVKEKEKKERERAFPDDDDDDDDF